MALQTIPSDVKIVGALQVTGTVTLVNPAFTNASLAGNADLVRSKMIQEAIEKYPIDLTRFRIWDAFQTVLPGTSTGDDLALVGATFATGVPSLESRDMGSLGAVSMYARCMFSLPPEYDDAETLQIRISAGMVTTISDTTATADVEVYLSDREGLISGSDLCSTAAQSMNSLTFADLDFTLTATSRAPGDMFDMRLTMAINDAATGAPVVLGRFGAVDVMADIRG